VAFHGLNGLRVAALTFGIGSRHVTAGIVAVIVAAAALTGLAALAILG
jgi:succinate dehydrogenase/fumarate reductase cytochrome b subunit